MSIYLHWVRQLLIKSSVPLFVASLLGDQTISFAGTFHSCTMVIFITRQVSLFIDWLGGGTYYYTRIIIINRMHSYYHKSRLIMPYRPFTFAFTTLILLPGWHKSFWRSVWLLMSKQRSRGWGGGGIATFHQMVWLGCRHEVCWHPERKNNGVNLPPPPCYLPWGGWSQIYERETKPATASRRLSCNHVCL